jgi:hypothetical protein
MQGEVGGNRAENGCQREIGLAKSGQHLFMKRRQTIQALAVRTD